MTHRTMIAPIVKKIQSRINSKIRSESFGVDAGLVVLFIMFPLYLFGPTGIGLEDVEVVVLFLIILIVLGNRINGFETPSTGDFHCLSLSAGSIRAYGFADSSASGTSVHSSLFPFIPLSVA